MSFLGEGIEFLFEGSTLKRKERGRERAHLSPKQPMFSCIISLLLLLLLLGSFSEWWTVAIFQISRYKEPSAGKSPCGEVSEWRTASIFSTPHRAASRELIEKNLGKEVRKQVTVEEWRGRGWKGWRGWEKQTEEKGARQLTLVSNQKNEITFP